MKYLIARLRGPGTLRSLIWVLMALAGLTVTDHAVAQVALLANVLLGGVSAALPEGPKLIPGVSVTELQPVRTDPGLAEAVAEALHRRMQGAAEAALGPVAGALAGAGAAREMVGRR